jgi:CheY-like chemotaxis protein
VARSITLELVEPCSEGAVARVDGVRLRQILVNLLSNAIKYNRAGGAIKVSCRPRGDERLRLAVTDTGIGIAADKLDRLFQPFERLDAESTGVEGTGIGLALSRQLANLMDAELGVESAVDVGTSFWIDLPIADATATAPAPDAGAPGPRFDAVGTVLCVEDNPSNLAVVSALLEPFPSIRLLTATDGAAGLAQARARHPDVILLDVHMPKMDGFAVLRELRAEPATRDIPVIALSADAMPEDIARGTAAGFDRYLTKPLVLNLLLAALAEFLGRGRSG